MKIVKLFVLCLMLSLCCNVVAQTNYASTIEYDKTIDKLIPKAKKNKLSEKQLLSFTNSYHEANQNDHQRIMELKKSGQPDIWIEIYHRIDNINTRQNKIAVLPDNIKSTIIPISAANRIDGILTVFNMVETEQLAGVQKLRVTGCHVSIF